MDIRYTEEEKRKTDIIHCILQLAELFLELIFLYSHIHSSICLDFLYQFLKFYNAYFSKW